MKHFILDLDQTIICANNPSSLNKLSSQHISKFKFHQMTDENDKVIYVIAERPYLQEFLDYIFKHFKVSVWTAATKSYAFFIVQNIILTKPNRKINYILYSDHCEYSTAKKKAIKSLSILWDLPGFKKENTIILDDNLEVFNEQKDNCIRAKPFYFTSEKRGVNDVFLKVLLEQLKYIYGKNNIENATVITNKINYFMNK